mmetsp:Transcript_9477/g.14089  ORF Transcript_9477/g.14089 Transcript_9477/m.14089 type:complete len:293 (+) Transcript_9477:73-951(+)
MTQVGMMKRKKGHLGEVAKISLVISWMVLGSFLKNPACAAFISSPTASPKNHQNHFGKSMRVSKLLSQKNGNGNKITERISSFEDAESKSSQGIVSTLTNFVNFVMGDSSSSSIGGTKNEHNGKFGASATTTSTIPPGSPEELLSRIRDDYVVYNYLWTGDIYTPAFEKDCRFTDPTLSFVGTDTFVSNVQNLKPIIDTLATGCKSDLLDICINEEEGYIESRWNMIGDLSGLPWKPRIDVIGRTKFWYRQVTDEGEDGVAGFRVFFYDEKWEMPAGKALLQLVTPTWRSGL